MTDPPPNGLDELLAVLEPLAAEARAERARGVPLDPEVHGLLTHGFVGALRARGWLQHVDPDRLVGVLEVVVVDEPDGGQTLHVDSGITDGTVAVPGWRIGDAATVGRGLGDDEADLLDAARADGDTTGWE